LRGCPSAFYPAHCLYNGDFGGGNEFQNDIVTSPGVSIVSDFSPASI
jgi:hypothetical protein